MEWYAGSTRERVERLRSEREEWKAEDNDGAEEKTRNGIWL